MARPQRMRKVCCMPKSTKFGALDSKSKNIIIMTVDEYEVIRLVDYEGMDQGECADKMNISRTTVQGIYTSARKKLSDLLVNGKLMSVEGGEYKLCEGLGCGNGCRKKRRITKGVEE